MTLQSQHQGNTSPNNYSPPNGSVYTAPWPLSSTLQQLEGLKLIKNNHNNPLNPNVKQMLIHRDGLNANATLFLVHR